MIHRKQEEVKRNQEIINREQEEINRKQETFNGKEEVAPLLGTELPDTTILRGILFITFSSSAGL
jgi:hypothetical protein